MNLLKLILFKATGAAASPTHTSAGVPGVAVLPGGGGGGGKRVPIYHNAHKLYQVPRGVALLLQN